MQKSYTVKQFKNYTSFSGKESKDPMKGAALLDPCNPSAYCEFLDAKGYRNFTYFKDWHTLFRNLPFYSKKRFIFELILSNRPCRPYLDVERIFESKPTKQFIDDFIKELKNQFNHRLQK